jgi:DNA uptake protein ComE-like DNA-binding protein
MRTSNLAALVVFALTLTPLASLPQDRDQDRTRALGTSANAPPPEMRIDINRASVEELLKVPGMTRSWAGRIVRFRPFRTKMDLVDRGVLTTQVYERIKDYVIAHRVSD